MLTAYFQPSGLWYVLSDTMELLTFALFRIIISARLSGCFLVGLDCMQVIIGPQFGSEARLKSNRWRISSTTIGDIVLSSLC